MTADRELAATVAELVGRMPGAELVACLEPARALAAPPACEVLLVGDHDDRSAADLAGELAVACPAAGIVVLARSADVATYRAALAAEARAVVPVPPAPTELVEAVGEAARGALAARPARSGVLVAVAGAVGGVGASAAAITLALAGGGLLADLSHAWAPASLAAPAGGSVADLARLGPAVGGALDAVVAQLPGGVQALPAPDDPELLELLPPSLGSVLARELRARASLAVADVGTVTHGAARELVAAADRLLVVVTPDVRAVTAARGLISAAARWGAPADASGVVVNRWNRFAELSAGGIERAVGSPVLAVVRERARRMHDYRNGRTDLGRWPGRTPFAALRPVVRDLTGGGA